MTTLKLDASVLTVGDFEDFEDHAGMTVEQALAAKKVKADEDTAPEFVSPDGYLLDGDGRPVKTVQLSSKVLKVLIWIVRRADDPSYTLDDARNEKITELHFEESSADPTQPPA